MHTYYYDTRSVVPPSKLIIIKISLFLLENRKSSINPTRKVISDYKNARIILVC